MGSISLRKHEMDHQKTNKSRNEETKKLRNQDDRMFDFIGCGHWPPFESHFLLCDILLSLAVTIVMPKAVFRRHVIKTAPCWMMYSMSDISLVIGCDRQFQFYRPMTLEPLIGNRKTCLFCYEPTLGNSCS